MKLIHKSALRGATCLNGAALAAALLALGQAAPVLAQQSAGNCEDVDSNGVCDAEESVIIVTGSRIRLPAMENKEPTVSLTSQYIDDRGLTNVADALNEIPGFRGSVTPGGSQASFGQGVNFINTYGLGSNRTLTLLNGRRVVSSNVTTIFGNASPGTQVDLNTIPVILIDRVDRVSTGGAPVYGTDAIAGTVNIILKKKFKGLELRASTGFTSEGDNLHYTLQGAGGMDFADGRGNITVAMSYDKVDGVLFNARDFYRANLGNLTNPCSTFGAGQPCSTAGSANLIANLGPVGRTTANDGRINSNIGFNNSLTDGFPGSVLVRGVTLPSLSRGGLISNGAQAYNYQFDASGNLVPFNRGIPYVAALPNLAARASGGQGFNFNDYSQITSDLERLSANLFFSYQLTDQVRFFAEGMFFEGKGNELVQQPTFNATAFGGVSGALTFRVDNPFLTAQARSTLASLGYAGTFQLSRANTDLADLTGSSDNKLYRGVFGFDGDFDMGGRKYNFEAYVNYGRNDFTDFGQNINQQKFINAVNVALVGGQIVCSTTATVIGTTPVADPNCKPLNLFGEGAPSADAIAYVLQNTVTKTRLEQFVANANVGGSPFDLFGNPVSFNLGFEHHQEKGAFNPDPFLQQGLGRSVAIAPTSGKYNLDEEFAEVLVPVISPENNFIFSKLEAYGRFRHVDNSVNGGFNAWAFGGSFAPIPDVEFRGNYTKSFRAPAIVELFAPQTNVFTTVPDLCSPANIAAGPAPATRTANCTAFLAKYPTATPLAAASATVPGLNGGNPKLGNETAKSFTYGAIFRPRFVRNLTVSVDYINIKIADPISSLTVATIAQSCFDNPDFNTADPANGNAFCSLIKRDANGQVINNAAAPGITSGYVNGKRITMDAVQATVDYYTKLSGIGLPGTLELGGDLFYLRNRLVDTTGVAPTQSEGLLGDPKWQGQARIRYTNKLWGMSTNVNYVGGQAISYTNRGPNPNDTREFDHFQPYATFDSSVWIDPSENLRVTLSVTNLTNRIGQKYYGYYIPASINDALGRRITMSVRQRF